VQQVIDRYQRVDPEQHEKLTQDYQKLQQQLQEYTTTQLENIKIIEKLNEELKQKSDAINKHETDSKKLQKYIKQQQSEIKKQQEETEKLKTDSTNVPNLQQQVQDLKKQIEENELNVQKNENEKKKN